MKAKYLVRPDDFSIWELDPDNGCYRGYPPMKHSDGTLVSAQKHFTFENLTKNYGWIPITEEEIPYYEEKCKYHYGFLGWQCRNDGHGEYKGGTEEEYREHLKRVEEYKKYKAENGKA